MIMNQPLAIIVDLNAMSKSNGGFTVKARLWHVFWREDNLSIDEALAWWKRREAEARLHQIVGFLRMGEPNTPWALREVCNDGSMTRNIDC